MRLTSFGLQAGLKVRRRGEFFAPRSHPRAPSRRAEGLAAKAVEPAQAGQPVNIASPVKPLPSKKTLLEIIESEII